MGPASGTTSRRAVADDCSLSFCLRTGREWERKSAFGCRKRFAGDGAHFHCLVDGVFLSCRLRKRPRSGGSELLLVVGLYHDTSYQLSVYRGPWEHLGQNL